MLLSFGKKEKTNNNKNNELFEEVNYDLKIIYRKYSGLFSILGILRDIEGYLSRINLNKIGNKKIKEEKGIYEFLRQKINLLIKEYKLRENYLNGDSSKIIEEEINKIILMINRNESIKKIVFEFYEFYRLLNTKFIEFKHNIEKLEEYLKVLKKAA
jgi:hypothetical protein